MRREVEKMQSAGSWDFYGRQVKQRLSCMWITPTNLGFSIIHARRSGKCSHTCNFQDTSIFFFGNNKTYMVHGNRFGDKCRSWRWCWPGVRGISAYLPLHQMCAWVNSEGASNRSQGYLSKVLVGVLLQLNMEQWCNMAGWFSVYL
jgi:hypothetical protein